MRDVLFTQFCDWTFGAGIAVAMAAITGSLLAGLLVAVLAFAASSLITYWVLDR